MPRQLLARLESRQRAASVSFQTGGSVGPSANLAELSRSCDPESPTVSHRPTAAARQCRL